MSREAGATKKAAVEAAPAKKAEPKSIKKRNGETVPFDAAKIQEAIRKACVAVPEEKISKKKLEELTAAVVAAIPGRRTPTVEQVQDLVEETLIREGFARTAKAYILYRAEHAKIRQSEGDLMEIYKELTFAYAKDADIKRENANIDADTAMGTMLKYGSEGSKYFIDNYILPKDVAAAHINGDIHIHDKDFYMLTETCCQIDLLKLFHNGFSTGHGYLREPNGIQSYSALGCIAIQANQNEMHGGQSVPNFDYSMAPGVRKTFRKEYFKALAHYIAFCYDMTQENAKALVDAAKEALGAEDLTMSEEAEYGMRLSRWLPRHQQEGGYQPITDAQTLNAHHAAVEVALIETDKATYQAMEALVHNLNTMNSRAGAQVPFSSINYGTDTSPEGRMVIKNLLDATSAGLGNGETPIFPVQIFKVKEGVSYAPGDPNYDLFQKAIRTSAKRLFPNFSFLDAPFNLQYYRPGDYNTEVSYMGCRTRVMGNHYDPSREVTCGRGNLSFTSINLPRIGIQAKGDIEEFYRILDQRVELVVRQLLHRFKIQAAKKCRNYPFLMGQGVWIDSDRLGIDDTIEEVIKHGTLSVGFIGLAETLVALTGKHHGESEESQKLGLEIVGHMRKLMDDKSEETGLNFTLLATPAEGLSGRFVRIDREMFGLIPGITDRDYYTNSFHVPVYYPVKAFRKIQLEGPYHALTNAGHISYVELDGDACKNPEAFEAVIRCMKENGIGYGSVNHPVDRDPICGYTGVIDDVCPRCGRREGEAVPVEKLRELRKQFPGMPRFIGLE
ncbi:MAG: anaerobic ribonucleoside triphosphate reductase [Angelakisella sp.]|jgi:anaerobic ribonucleoside-triphosphate reductase|nr:anaerobic ribonucleoside triphosphate reductase [Angelakisella sp.]MCI9665927.1 anaerobic ribonucleoside triphosphate reductase [Angelakisella sp.]